MQPQDPAAIAQARQTAMTAQKLVNLSHIFGWGGLGMLFVGAPAVGIGLHSGFGAMVLAGGGILSAIGGAIIGQVGRGMQGRVI